HTSSYYEAQNGSFGFQYLMILPLAMLGFAVIRRRPALGAGVIGIGAAVLIARSNPNVRYLYAALPLCFVPFGALLGWMSENQRWLYRLTILFLMASAALNAWFLPASGYYHKDFCLRLPFARAERERYLREAAPVRDVVAYYNRVHG